MTVILMIDNDYTGKMDGEDDHFCIFGCITVWVFEQMNFFIIAGLISFNVLNVTEISLHCWTSFLHQYDQNQHLLYW